MIRRAPVALLIAAWSATRALMLWLLALDGHPLLGGGGVSREVRELYHHWYGVLSHGGFPVGDPLWQYPPGAGPVLLSPGLLPGLAYVHAFVALVLAADVVITAALVRAGTAPTRSLRGAAYWIGGLPLLLHVPLARYDVQVTALAVLALLALPRSTRACGALVALGALVKVWPVLVLPGVPKGRAARTACLCAAATGTAALTALALALDRPLDFLRNQGGRGVQIESVGGALLSLASHAGWPGTVRYRYGAMEFTGPYASSVAHASLALTAGAFAMLLLWRARARRWTPATPYDAALCAVLLFTVTSRVISPQYMIWLLGLSAVCLSSRHTAQRPVTALVAAATALSAVIYPVCYDEVMAGTWPGTALLVARNALLLAAAALSYVHLWRTTRPAPSFPGQQQHPALTSPAGQ
ncbi:glycosyltransferase 87 family protein [Streptomyces sp. NPDC006186]|uniref:glycosyltransferase 87 family protein n=1 Tax=Streptomyces sp. NPDC006186 TaxID=3155248 RepID=UPI0033B8E30C